MEMDVHLEVRGDGGGFRIAFWVVGGGEDRVQGIDRS
jgi:hypothetical protein